LQGPRWAATGRKTANESKDRIENVKLVPSLAVEDRE